MELWIIMFLYVLLWSSLWTRLNTIGSRLLPRTSALSAGGEPNLVQFKTELNQGLGSPSWILLEFPLRGLAARAMCAEPPFFHLNQPAVQFWLGWMDGWPDGWMDQ